MELLKLLFERADALNGYWNLYIAVSLGVLGLMASGKSFTHLRQTKVLLTVAFALFAYSNLEVLIDTNEQRRALGKLIASEFSAAAAHAAPPPDWKLIAFHVGLDLVVILSIWLVRWYTPKEERAG